jgi:hypothetical protein
MPLEALRRIQYGRESTAARGTSVAADAILLGTLTMNSNLALHIPEDEERNSLAMAHRSTIVGRHSELQFESALQFESMHHILDLALSGQSCSQVLASTNGTVTQWTFTRNSTARNWPGSYTFEYGDEQQEYESAFVMAEQLEITYAMAEPVRQSLSMFGRVETTASFTGSLTAPTVEEAVSARTTFYMDTAWANLGNSTADGFLVNATLRFPTGLQRSKYADGSLDWSSFAEGRHGGEVELTAVHNSSGKELYDAYRNQSLLYLRLETLGSTVGGSSASAQRTLRVDLAMRVTEPVQMFGAQDGENTFVARGRVFADSCGHNLEVVVINTSTQTSADL